MRLRGGGVAAAGLDRFGARFVLHAVAAATLHRRTKTVTMAWNLLQRAAYVAGVPLARALLPARGQPAAPAGGGAFHSVRSGSLNTAASAQAAAGPVFRRRPLGFVLGAPATTQAMTQVLCGRLPEAGLHRSNPLAAAVVPVRRMRARGALAAPVGVGHNYVGWLHL